jgi:hypothetical protein
MFRPRFERLSDVRLVEGNSEIQTLATCNPYQSFDYREGKLPPFPVFSGISDGQLKAGVVRYFLLHD